MSTDTAVPSVHSEQQTPAWSGSGLTFPHLVRAEWHKLKTLRSTWFTLTGAVIILVLAAVLIANHLHGNLIHPGQAHDPGDRDVLITPLRGFGVTQLIMGVLGVLSITGEYATGMIRATFTAVPKRLPVIAAKIVVFAALGFATMLFASFAAFFTSQAILGTYGVGLGANHALRVIIALAGYLTLVGLLGLGIGFIVRSTAGGIASLVGLLLVAPGILAALSTSWADTASRYLPLNAGVAMFNNSPATGGDLTPGGGLTVMGLWVLASFIGATIMVSTRDA